MRVILSFLVTLMIGFMPVHVHAAQENEGNNVFVSLYTDKDAAVPGQNFNLLVKQDIADHWHTYWINPGDSGAPTKFNLELPEGFSLGEPKWPIPEVIPFGPLTNYGYEEEALYIIPVNVPNDVSANNITISGNLEWLVCHDICIPEFQEVSLTLPIAQTSNAINGELFKKAQKNIPLTNNDLDVVYQKSGEDFALKISGMPTEAKIDALRFFPYEWGVILNPADQEISRIDDVFIIETSSDSRDLSELNNMVSGIISVGDVAYQITAKEGIIVGANQNDKSLASIAIDPELSLPLIIFFAFIGGMILNLMPCVFPVLSMKALSLVKLSDSEKGHMVMHGLSYTLGIILSFLLIAGSLIVLQQAGAQIGWGFQLQDPVVTGLLAYLLFVLGLNLFGYFEFNGSFMNAGQGLANKSGLSGSFFTGVLATLVATPCTAPFMATALGYALTQPPEISMLVFSSLGLGLAFPYLILTIIPGLQKTLPKPGPWMDRFKQFLAFPMLLSALWLAWVFAQQSSVMAFACLMIGAVAIAFAIWLFKHRPTRNGLVRVFAYILIIMSLGMALSVPYGVKKMEAGDISVEVPVEKNWLAFTPKILEEQLESGNAVFVDMTAAWCITCQVNKRVALSGSKFYQYVDENDITLIRGDWTNQDPAITKYLESFDRNGVPIYVYYPAQNGDGERSEPVVLPQLLTQSIVLNTFKNN